MGLALRIEALHWWQVLYLKSLHLLPLAGSLMTEITVSTKRMCLGFHDGGSWSAGINEEHDR